MVCVGCASLFFVTILASSQNASPSETSESDGDGFRRPRLEAKRQLVCKEPALHRAIRRSDTNAVDKYLQTGGDIYALDCHGMSAMHVAVADRKNAMISALLTKGFDINKVFPGGGTILLFAVMNRTDAVHSLIKLGADINVKYGPKSQTFLHRAVDDGKLDLIVRLIQFGADVDAQDGNGETPLACAVRKRSPEMVYLILTGGAESSRITKEYGSYLHLAVSANCTECLRNILSRGLPADTLDSNGTTALMLAVSRDDPSAAAALADSGANVGQPIGTGTLLHLAAKKGSPGCIAWLVEQGLPPDSKDAEGNSPIMLAVGRDDVASTAALADRGADVRQQCSYGTLLHLAAEKGSFKCIRWLVQRGIPPDARDTKGNTPMMIAIQRDDTRCLYALDEFGADLSGTLLHFAVKKGSPNSIRWLVQRGIDPDAKDSEGNTPIVVAIELDDTVSTRTLGESGADLYQRVGRGNLLHFATRKKSANALRWLTQHGPPVEERDDDVTTPITYAVGLDDTASMAVLAEAGADLEEVINSDDVTLLHHAAFMDSVNAIRWLVQQGLDVNQTDTGRLWNPLHHAAFHNRFASVKLLLQLGACNTCKDKWGVTPIMRAIEKDNIDLEAALVEGGVDLHQLLEGNSINLLHFAATRGSLKSIRWLVEKGLDIDEVDKPRLWTPLHHAAFHGKLDSAKVVVDLQSFINYKDKWGSTPLALARNYNHPDVAAFLETKGGRV